ncbi:peptide chain release factor 1 [Metallosphaera tengchongensis]|uniref:Peptide chain release factor subunit 1 n=1 Tax=Metallosphaera tengchongensis TaxID=1532350 RepID=A0A6N0NVY8_9CREN|nr:peptide chain release factor aRF-1 [Metallosphaera tengchongensis]QKR00385.1 peptide chain release factor 1 [Metallosphaera tengchongensis]
MKVLLRELKKWSAPATVLLSLYIPPNRPVSDVVNMLRQEASISQNIKLKRTRDAVESAITSAIDRLVTLNKVPENGLVLFCGENFDNGDFRCYMFTPPEKVNVYFYRTDKQFHTEFLEDMVEVSEIYGLLIVERDQGTIGVLRGSRIEVLEEMEGYVPGKHMMGGQSQRRIDRIIEELYHDFLKSFGEKVNNYLLPYLEGGKLKGILLGGPGYAKKDFYDSDYIDYRLKKLIMLPLVDIGYQGEAGLREMVMKSKDQLKNQKYIEVEDLIEELKFHLAKDDGLVIYGKEEILKALQMGAVDRLIIFDDGNPENEKLMQEAEKYGTTVYLVGDEIPEAEWVRKTFNGMIGKLRYKV